MAHKDRQPIVVTRERVLAPPDRFIPVGEDQLIDYFKGVFGSELAPAVPVLHQLIESCTTADFAALRRRLLDNYDYFGKAAEGRTGVELRPNEELDKQELAFLADFVQLMEAAQYRQLHRAEWDAAQAEDFLFTLPCHVKWSAMDTKMLRRYWAAYPEERADAPEETAERIMVFQRGAEVATMQGSYFLLKVNLIISMWILQPLHRLFCWVMHQLKMQHYIPAPKGGSQDDSAAQAALERAAKQELHPATVEIERRTHARVFPDGLSVLKQFFKTVKLREACFRDVIVLYRLAVPDTPAPANEIEIIKEADPKLMQRNIVLKQFRGIPLADLEMVMPEKRVFVPPKVFVEMAITLVGGVAALATALWSGAKEGRGLAAAWTGLSLLAARAMQVYTSALAQKNLIENTMGKLLYERTVGSGVGVLTNLVDGMSRQRVREILICYCILLDSQKPLTAGELDAACERFLATQFGCKIDFCCEEALPAILKWGLAAEDKAGALTAVPLPKALQRLDEVFDNIFSFSGSAKAILAKAASAADGSAAAAAVAETAASSSGAAGNGAGSTGGHALGKSLSQKRLPVTVAPVAGGASPAATPTKKKKGLFARIGRAFS